MAGQAVVSVVRTGPSPDEDGVRAAVRAAVTMAGGIEDIVSAGKLVLIKPNLVAIGPSPRSGVVTNPAVCRALADMVSARGARAVIADSAAVGIDTEAVIEVEGYARLRGLGYGVVDLKGTAGTRVTVPGVSPPRTLRLYRLAVEADVVISVPVLKTHDQTVVSLGLKNLKGLAVDEEKKRMHRTGVCEGVADLASVIRPALVVIDGTTAQEGMGPVYGRPVEMGVILAGRDPVAVDAVGAYLMGFHPEHLSVIGYAARRGVGTMDLASIRVVGEDPGTVRRRFLRAEEDATISTTGVRLVMPAGTCTGCHTTVLSTLVQLEKEGMSRLLRDRVVVAGTVNPGELPRVEPEKLVLVGSCTAAYRRRGVFVNGCPPENGLLASVLTGANPQELTAHGDNEKAGGSGVTRE